MPGFDGTGPFGQGPFTGGGRGFCIMPLDERRPFAGVQNYQQNIPYSNLQTENMLIKQPYPYYPYCFGPAGYPVRQTGYLRVRGNKAARRAGRRF